MSPRRTFWTLVLASAAILAVTMGVRQTAGLFVSSINSSTGLGIVTVSLAMAVGQFVWGAAQPLFGMLADRVGSYRVILIGGLLLAFGMAITPFVSSAFGLIFAMGVLTAAGAGAGSFSILIGAAAQRLPADRRSFAAGFINAGGSFGQFLFAPVAQALITAFGWVTAMLALAATTLSTILLALPLRQSKAAAAAQAVLPAGEMTLGEQTRVAFRDPSYWCLHAGFFTCGFHIAFLVTHLPGEVSLCGLPASVSATVLAIIGLGNIVGSIGAGWLGQTKRMKMILVWMYGSRAVAVAIYLMAPKTDLTFYLFAAVLGLTWLSTVPPTNALVAQIFGVQYLSMLGGLVFLSHQMGSFMGVWLGGKLYDATGNYDLVWWVAVMLGLVAAACNLPVRESPIVRGDAMPAAA